MYNTFDRSRIYNFFEKLSSLKKGPKLLNMADGSSAMPIEERQKQVKDKTHLVAKDMDQKLAISSISVGFVAAGSFFYAPLGAIALPGLLYQSIDLGRNAFSSLKNKNEVSRSFLDLLVFGLCFSQGYYILGSLALCSHYFTNKVLFQSDKEAYKTLSEAVGKEPSKAWLLKDGVEIEVNTNTLQVGQSVVIHAGELIPVDGLIIDGIGLIDGRILNGFAPPTVKNSDEKVVSGNILLAGRIVVQIESVGDMTCMAKMLAQLTQGTEDQTTLQRWSQKLSPVIALSQLVGGGLASFMFSPMSIAAIMGARSDYNQIAPVEIATWLENALQNGIFIRNTKALELLKQVDTVVIDYAIDEQSVEELNSVINSLRDHKIKSVYLFTTDSIPEEVGRTIDHYLIDATMPEKVECLVGLRASQATVCYISDTITNEIKQATAVSIRLSHITYKEELSADIFLLNGTLQQVDEILKMAKSFNRHKKSTFLRSIAPPLLALSAPFAFKSGLIATIALNQIGTFSSLNHAQQISHSND